MLSIQDSHVSSVLRCLDNQVCKAIQNSNDRIQVWQPEHEVLEHVFRLSSGPLVSFAARDSKGRLANSAEQLNPEESILAIDDGEVLAPGEPTVVAIDGNTGQIIHQGMVNEPGLRQISKWIVLFVCTGNTCRSPMAQAMM